jgi:hypothetical protein
VTTYAQQSPDRPLPAGTFTIRPCDWAEKMRPRPVADVVVGLRLPSDEDEAYAKRQAAENSAKNPLELGRWLKICCVARAICDPKNASEISESFPAPDDQLADEVKPETITAMFDELERLSIAVSPIRPEATDEEVIYLMTVLGDGALQIVESDNPMKAMRARRYIRYVLDELTDD